MKIRIDYTREELKKIRVESIKSIKEILDEGWLPASYREVWNKYFKSWNYCSLEDIALSLGVCVKRNIYCHYDFEPEIYIDGEKIEGEPNFYLLFIGSYEDDNEFDFLDKIDDEFYNKIEGRNF